MKQMLLLAIISTLVLSANADNPIIDKLKKEGVTSKDCDILIKLEEKRKNGSFNFVPMTNIKTNTDSKTFLALLEKYR